MAKQRLQLTWYNKDMALIPTEAGRYGYSWVDPDDPRYCETHTLVMDGYIQGKQTQKSEDNFYSERADLEPQTDNLLINGESGDVLEALTRVPELAKKYAGHVKLIYIDPPFNTKQTFNSYEDNLEHSIWLTLMRDRLINLRKLLCDEGTIWVHLDDAEVHRMRCLLDEVFSPACFVTTIAWEKAQGARNDTDISSAQDLILVYKKCATADFKTVRHLLPRTAAQISRYQNPDNDPRGPWRQGDNGTAKSGSDDYRFPIELPSGRVVTPPAGTYWRFSKESFETAKRENRIWFGAAGDSMPVIKRYLNEVQQGVVPRTWWPASEVGSNQEAKRDHLRKMFPGKEPFATPKPERLLERIIHIATNPGDIVLDCFAGSGTTAAVAQKMGRRWVTCELLESNYSTYDVPRLTKVVNDEDPGGITQSKPERIAADGVELPDGVSPDNAAQFTSVLNKLIADDEDLKKDKAVKALKKLAKTEKSKPTINWRGGGGFQTAHLSPACFGYDPDLDRVVLTPDATGEMLVRSVAANLGFSLIPPEERSPFDGARGKTLLKVYEGVADPALVDLLAAQVPKGHSLVLAATSVFDGTREHLRRVCKGSRVVHVPDGVFPYTKGGAR